MKLDLKSMYRVTRLESRQNEKEMFHMIRNFLNFSMNYSTEFNEPTGLNR